MALRNFPNSHFEFAAKVTIFDASIATKHVHAHQMKIVIVSDQGNKNLMAIVTY